jgi:hypothetical protein
MDGDGDGAAGTGSQIGGGGRASDEEALGSDDRLLGGDDGDGQGSVAADRPVYRGMLPEEL